MKSRYRDSAEQASRPLSPRLGMGLGSEAGAGLQRRVLSFVRVSLRTRRRCWGINLLSVCVSLLNTGQQIWAAPSEETARVDEREHVPADEFRRELIPIPMGVLDAEVAGHSRQVKGLLEAARKQRSNDHASVKTFELTLQTSGNQKLQAMRERLQFLDSACHTVRLTQFLLYTDPEGDEYLAQQHQFAWVAAEGIDDLRRRFRESRKLWMEYKRASSLLRDGSRLRREEEAEIYQRSLLIEESFRERVSLLMVEQQELREEYINQLVQHRLLNRTEAHVLTYSDELKAVTRIQSLLRSRYRLPIK